MIFDSVYDIYRGVVTYVRVVDGKITPARAHRDDVHRRHPRTARGRHRLARTEAQRRPGCGGGGLPDHRGQGRPPVQGRRHRDDGPPRRQGGADRLPRTQADGLLGAVSRRRFGLPGPARRPGQAAAQRRGADLRAGNVGGAGLRVPVRLPGPAAHGDHPRAPGARVRPGPDLDVAERRLPGDQRGRHRDRGDQPVGLARGQGPHGLRARRQDHHHRAQRVHRHHHGAVPVAPRRAGRHGLPVAGAGGAALHHAAWGRSSSTSSTR